MRGLEKGRILACRKKKGKTAPPGPAVCSACAIPPGTLCGRITSVHGQVKRIARWGSTENSRSTRVVAPDNLRSGFATSTRQGVGRDSPGRRGRDRGTPQVVSEQRDRHDERHLAATVRVDEVHDSRLSPALSRVLKNPKTRGKTLAEYKTGMVAAATIGTRAGHQARERSDAHLSRRDETDLPIS